MSFPVQRALREVGADDPTAVPSNLIHSVSKGSFPQTQEQRGTLTCRENPDTTALPLLLSSFPWEAAIGWGTPVMFQ